MQVAARPPAALGPDQRAVLDLVAGRGLAYAAIAQVTRVPEQTVRARARDALATLGGADPGDAVTAFLLGVADPDERRTARALLREDAEARALAQRVAAALEAEWAGFAAPVLPRPAAARRSSLVLAAAGAALAGVVVAALALTGVIGGGDSGAGSSRDAVPAPVRITLRAADGSGAGGVAVIGVTAAYRPYMQLDLTNLAPPPRGSVYLLWADNGTGHGFPLPTPIQAGASGAFHQRYSLSPALAPLLAVSRSLDLVAVGAGRLAGLARQVTATGTTGGAGVTLPSRPGAVVLTGRIPVR